MALTSTEIARLLQPMKDFAPAILRCAEIVESAEQAERLIREQASTVKAAQDALDSLTALKREAEDELRSLRASVETAKVDTAQEKIALAEKLKGTKEKLKMAEDALTATHQEHASLLAAHKQELDGLDIVLTAKKQELADFRRAIPKTY